MEVDYLEVCGSKIKAFEFKWNPKKKSRVGIDFFVKRNKFFGEMGGECFKNTCIVIGNQKGSLY